MVNGQSCKCKQLTDRPVGREKTTVVANEIGTPNYSAAVYKLPYRPRSLSDYNNCRCILSWLDKSRSRCITPRNLRSLCSRFTSRNCTSGKCKINVNLSPIARFFAVVYGDDRTIFLCCAQRRSHDFSLLCTYVMYKTAKNRAIGAESLTIHMRCKWKIVLYAARRAIATVRPGVYVCYAPSRSYPATTGVYKKGPGFQVHVPKSFVLHGFFEISVLINLYILTETIWAYSLRKLWFACTFVSGNLKVHGFAQTCGRSVYFTSSF